MPSGATASISSLTVENGNAGQRRRHRQPRHADAEQRRRLRQFLRLTLAAASTYNGTLTLSNVHRLRIIPAAVSGGGIDNSGNGTLTLNNVIISGNTAESGGGIYNDAENTMTLSNCHPLRQFGVYYGGGIYNGAR